MGSVISFGFDERGGLGLGYMVEHLKVPRGTLFKGAIAVVGCGSDSCILHANGDVFGIGGCKYGQLAIGHGCDGKLYPVKFLLSNVKAIGSNGAHGLALLRDGTLKTWGGNLFGTRGNGTSWEGKEAPNAEGDVCATPLDPIMPEPGLTFEAVAGGSYFSMALSTDGRVVCWGDRVSVGDGTEVEKSVPTFLPGIENAIAIAGGFRMALCLLEDGTVLGWGRNHYGQLGSTPGSKQEQHILTPTPLTNLAEHGPIAGIACLANTGLALTQTGDVLAWGENEGGQLGLGTTDALPHPAPTVAFTGAHVIGGGDRLALAIRRGALYQWGSLRYGQFEPPILTPTFIPTPSPAEEISVGEGNVMILLKGAGLPVPVTGSVNKRLETLNLTWVSDPSVGAGGWEYGIRPQLSREEEEEIEEGAKPEPTSTRVHLEGSPTSAAIPLPEGKDYIVHLRGPAEWAPVTFKTARMRTT